MSQPRIAPSRDGRGIHARFAMKFKRQTMRSRLIAQGALITTQEQVDNILKHAPKEIGEAWLQQFGPYLPFVPRQLRSEPVQPGQD